MNIALTTFKDELNALLKNGSFYFALGIATVILITVVVLLVISRKKKK